MNSATASLTGTLVLTALAAILLGGCAARAEDDGPASTEGAVSAGDEASRCTITKDSACLLSVDTPKTRIVVNYPGLSLCGLRMFATNPFPGEDASKELTEGLTFTRYLGASREGFVYDIERPADALNFRVDFSAESFYVTDIEVATKSGEPLSRFVARILKPSAAMADETVGPIQLVAIGEACRE